MKVKEGKRWKEMDLLQADSGKDVGDRWLLPDPPLRGMEFAPNSTMASAHATLWTGFGGRRGNPEPNKAGTFETRALR